MDKGQLVPDEVVIDMLFSVMLQHKESKGFVFDGFPRTLIQAEKFDEMLELNNIPIKMVISLEVNDDELIKRLVKRGIESGRADDTEEVIAKRLLVYNDQTKPLLDYYAKKKILKHVHGIGPIDDIFGDICSVIDSSIN
jgi:adenylate kinase